MKLDTIAFMTEFFRRTLSESALEEEEAREWHHHHHVDPFANFMLNMTTTLAPTEATTGISVWDDAEETSTARLTNQALIPAERILPRITAFMSLVAVVCVALEAWGDMRKLKNKDGTARSLRHKNLHIIAHIQFCYQVALFCYCLAFFLGSTTAPSDQGIVGAIGNQATCSMQATLFQFGLWACIGWDAALTTTYWSVCRSKTNVWKKVWHSCIWPIALGVSLYPLIGTTLYNFNYNVCWIHEHPDNCHLDDTCERGANALFWTNLASGIAVLHLIYSIGLMVALYCWIRKLEQQNRDSSVSSSHAASRAFAVQGLLYGSVLLTTMLPTAVMIILANSIGFWSAALSIFSLTMTPLVGYLNFLVFMRKRKECHTRYGRFLRRIHFEWRLPSCGMTLGEDDDSELLPSPGAMQFSDTPPRLKQPQSSGRTTDRPTTTERRISFAPSHELIPTSTARTTSHPSRDALVPVWTTEDSRCIMEV